MALEINTIGKYFGKIYNEAELAEFNKRLIIKLLSYKFPMEICLSSIYQNFTLLGTLTFEELDLNGYPIYTGDVTKSTEGLIGITYYTTLNFDKVANRWVFALSRFKGEPAEITISSVRTTSLDPTKVDYSEISRPTSGACAK